MKKNPLFLNLMLVSMPLVIPRIPPDRLGDPILQMLYIFVGLPVAACLLNLKFHDKELTTRPRLTALFVCAAGSSVAYLKWVLISGRPFLQWDSIEVFLSAMVVGGCISVSLFGLIYSYRSWVTRGRAYSS